MEQQRLNKEALQHELEQTFHDLLQTLGSFDQEQYNIVPFEGSWTAGQVSEHLFKSVSGIPELIQAETADTERAPDEQIANIKAVFLNFDNKMKSPDFILPGNGPHQKQVFIDDFLAVSIKMKDIVATEDLTRTCTSFAFPTVGNLTRWEWLWFGICHTQRHTNQLKNIRNKLGS